MRDIVIARRALLAFAGGLALAGLPLRLAEARRIVRHRGGSGRRHRHVIVLDPGHGGSDPGAISPHGLYEKTVTLATARELARLLAATGRYRPLLIRRRDVYVPLRRRVQRARAWHAELFLSLHADKLPDRGLRGLSVYTLSEKASDRETAALADSENRDVSVDGVRLSRQPRRIAAILLDLARRRTDNLSLALAHDVVAAMGHRVPLLERPHRSAAFVVLTAPDIPSVLVELGCLSNPIDERLLRTHAYQRRLAHRLVHAIDDYFATAAAVDSDAGALTGGPFDAHSRAWLPG
jgi:N-acetylmuramoyl-L-alanine amidase